MDTEAFPRQYARTRRFSLGEPGEFTVSPDGTRVLFTRTVSGSDTRTLLWLHEDGGERLLADPAAPGVGSYAADRDARLAVYLLDGQVWTVRTDGGEPQWVPTAGPASDARPSPDGSLIAYVTGGALHVMRVDGTDDRVLARPEAADVAYGVTDHTPLGPRRGLSWSPDGRALLVVRVDTSMVQRRYVHDPAYPQRPPRAVPYPAAGTANPHTSVVLVSVDGRRVPVDLPRRVPEDEQPAGVWRAPAFEYLVAAAWEDLGPVVALQSRDQRTVWTLRVDPSDGSVEVIARQVDATWVHIAPGTPRFTASGLPVLSHTAGDTRTLRVGETIGPDGLQVEQVVGVAGERVLFTAGTTPLETHVWSYQPGEGFTQLTHAPGVHTAALGGSTVVLDSRTETDRTITLSRGGQPAGQIAVLTEKMLVDPRPILLTLGARELNAHLYLPSWHRSGERLPVLLNPYGGPALRMVTRAPIWRGAMARWFAEQGFAVLVADGRGTPGRGVAWEREVFGDRLGPVLQDQVDALHAAAERYPDLDLERVGIRGWSFGGYLTAAAVLLRPDVFHAAVAGAAPTDRRLYHTHWEERWLGHPDVQPENYERCDLLPLAPKLARPLLLVQGSVDDNVFPAHTMRLSAALLAAGRPHAVLPLTGIGHRNDRPGVGDMLALLERDFFRRELRADGP